jgi:mRNA-degrading endonuclease RelE of RelBE toxin-antitoxin system
MQFVETPIFTKAVQEQLSAESYRALQLALALRPEQGNVIQGSGGLRKLRWAGSGRGKSGGVRVIYYWDEEGSIIYMLLLYAKNVQDTLTPQQLKILKSLVKGELK